MHPPQLLAFLEICYIFCRGANFKKIYFEKIYLQIRGQGGKFMRLPQLLAFLEICYIFCQGTNSKKIYFVKIYLQIRGQGGKFMRPPQLLAFLGNILPLLERV